MRFTLGFLCIVIVPLQFAVYSVLMGSGARSVESGEDAPARNKGINVYSVRN